MRRVAVLLLVAFAAFGAEHKGILLQRLTWQEAERVLRPETIVVIPLGAASKEHGPHLPLETDFLQAEYLKERVLRDADVVVAPTVGYAYYPAFLEYPGSTSLTLETTRDTIVGICETLSRFGPRRFYVLNTGISTLRALAPAAEALAAKGIVLRYTDLTKILGPVEKQISKQPGGSHADEIETSIMLYIAPRRVDMKKAANDYHPAPGPLTRDPHGSGAYSPTGIYGDATLATREKGRIATEAYVAGVLRDIAELRAVSSPPTPADANADVRAAMSGFMDALNALDADRMATYFADDVTAFFPVATAERVNGKAAVVAIFQTYVAETRKTIPKTNIVPEDLRVDRNGEGAVVTFNVHNPSAVSRRTFVWKREGGRWVIAHLHASNFRM